RPTTGGREGTAGPGARYPVRHANGSSARVIRRPPEKPPDETPALIVAARGRAARCRLLGSLPSAGRHRRTVPPGVTRPPGRHARRPCPRRESERVRPAHGPAGLYDRGCRVGYGRGRGLATAGDGRVP